MSLDILGPPYSGGYSRQGSEGIVLLKQVLAGILFALWHWDRSSVSERSDMDAPSQTYGWVVPVRAHAVNPL